MVAFVLGGDAWGFPAERFWAAGVAFLMKLRVRVEMETEFPARGGLILAPNHESWFDIPLVLFLPTNFRWVAKRELRWVPLLGWGLVASGTLFLRRSGSQKDLQTMKELEDSLRRGERCVIFPEGTRTRDGKMLPFRRGAFRAAQNAGIPIYPVGIHGTYPIAPPGKLPHHTGFDITVRVGKPFTVPPGTDVAPIVETFRQEVYRLSRGLK